MKKTIVFGLMLLTLCMTFPVFAQENATKKNPERIHTAFWNYHKFKDFRMEMLHDWADCGMTLCTSNIFDWKNDSPEDFIRMLDEAEKLGVQMIIQVDELFADRVLKDKNRYRQVATEMYEKFGKHPAVYSLHIVDELGDGDYYFFEAAKVLREVAPDLKFNCNLGDSSFLQRALEKRNTTMTEWMKTFTPITGSRLIGFGCYEQTIPGPEAQAKIGNYFKILRDVTEAAKPGDLDVWATLLSSAHLPFEAPTEDQYRWQLNTAVACGCRAVMWFRMMDKLVAEDYRNSPIDEFGEKTPYYYNLRRVQKRFQIHHGEIFARLRHVDTYFIDTYSLDVAYGKLFKKGACDLVANAESPHGMISYFKDKDGGDYIVVLNTSQTIDRAIKLTFTEKVKSADKLYFNGDMVVDIFRRDGRTGDISIGEMWLAPGQMELIKIN